MARLRDVYKSNIVPALQEKFDYKSPMAIPRVEKIVVSMGVGKAIQDKKFLETATEDITLITGQKPLVCKAKVSVSNFKLREDEPIGLKVTLRGERMYEFLDRLINLAIPRVKDFRGLSTKSFDGRGNYAIGFSEQSIFPEIDSARITAPQGMNICVVTTANTNEESLEMLRLFGMPFKN
ncbi:50S ribosomal protein L5 [Limihaloglobus sulfuriphilus]|uniref:Large ribosomal subunit protein uL5 n=1 Tax=Limihaloglobus sulfuriphilus TaxID=1851148 RepID=A0A1Q2MHA9_9BACT|nr:50S ribosomal protein L5 [Limihaloglobus sulfuriphilus]AQQ72044.1 50S ribosomal protein L5 [Limihaloglobus sulfuriphilus]